jgi:uncharacterized protein (TIGR02246 family)
MEGEKNMEQELSHESLEDLARRNMAAWIETLKKKDPKEVADFYTEDNIFLPTVSGKLRSGKAEAQDYFAHFLMKNPEGEVVEEAFKQMGDNYYLHAGMYNFVLDGDEKRIIKPCRFSYNWEKGSDNKWRICHHHSSDRPKGE